MVVEERKTKASANVNKAPRYADCDAEYAEYRDAFRKLCRHKMSIRQRVIRAIDSQLLINAVTGQVELSSKPLS